MVGVSEGTPSGHGTRLRRDIFWLALAAATLAYAGHVYAIYGQATVDDAAISYAYADNIAWGDGFRLTRGEAPAEGYSNPLEVFLLVPFARLVGNLDLVAKVLNIGAAAVAIGLFCAFLAVRLNGVERWLSLLPLGLATYWCGFNYWIAAGLEGGLLAGLQIGSGLALWVASRRRAADVALGVVAGLLAWVRPEALVYGAIAVAVRLAQGGRRRLVAPLLFAVFTAALFGLRWVLFRDVVPNTYWAKVPSLPLNEAIFDPQSAGVDYLRGFFLARRWYFVLPLFLFAPLYRRGAAVCLAALLQLVVALLFAVATGGDWMREWRLMQPMMGPLLVLSGLGVLGILRPVSRRPRTGRWRPALLAVAAVAGLVYASYWLDWPRHRDGINANRNVDMRWTARRVPRYLALLERANLGRRPLVAEVDVGGTAFQTPIDVLDVGGLTDRVLARARARWPAVAPDYVFGERRPELVFLHSSWLWNTPLQQLSAFESSYRVVAPAHLATLGLAGLVGIRADLLDPLAAPVRRVDADLPGARLHGVTAIATEEGYALMLHARRAGDEPLVRPLWIAADGTNFRGRWHAGVPLRPGPPGSALVAITRVPAWARLPLTLSGTEVRLDRWPIAEPGADSVVGLSQRPLARLAGRPPLPCRPDSLLDPAASLVARARGAGFVARLCGPLPGHQGEVWRGRALAAAIGAWTADDRYEAAVATFPMGPPQTLGTRLLIEQARLHHAPFDEILEVSAHRDLVDPARRPERAAFALRLLLAARRFDEVVLQALAIGTEADEIRVALCTASRRLGLRPDRVVPGVDCAAVGDAAPVALRRQSFEDPGDPELSYEGPLAVLAPTPSRRIDAGQHLLAGGHGRRVLNSYGPRRGNAAVGEVVWGPLPWSGRRFGALVGGGSAPETLYVAVEGRFDGAWRELARVTAAVNDGVLRPRLVDLGDAVADAVRVRVVDAADGAWGHILADALTFIDAPGLDGE